MKSLTPSKLIALLQGTAGAVPVGIEAETDARLLKTGNPYKNCLKYIRAVGFCGANYQRAVRREGERQEAENSANFVAGALPWEGAEWIIPNKIIFYKGEYYLRLQTTPKQRNRQPAKVLSYRADGEYVDYEKIKQFISEKGESKKQQRAGLDETVAVRTYKFSSLKKIRISGTTYELTGNEPVIRSPKPRKATKRRPKFNPFDESGRYAGLGSYPDFNDYKEINPWKLKFKVKIL